MSENEIVKKISSFDKWEYLLFSGVVVYFIVFLYLGIARHHSYQSYMLDLALFDQCFWTTIHGSFFYTTVEANMGISNFGVHNPLILLTIIPFYYLFPSAELLIGIQCLAVALAAIPLFYIGKEYLGNKGALVLCTAYFLYAPLHGVTLMDFHEFAFAPLILFTCFYFLLKKEIFGFVISSCFALMIREEIVFIIILMALYGLIKNNFYTNERDRLILALTVLLAAFWFMISVVVIIPYFNPVHRYFPIAGHWGGNSVTDLITVDPLLKSAFLFELFSPLGFLSFFSPGILLTAAPAFVGILYSKYMVYTIAFWHQALLIPAIFVSCIFGVKKFVTKNGYTGRWTENRIYGYILICSIVSFLVFTPSPLSPVSIYREDYTITQHHKILDDAISLIPPDASVATQNDLGSHLAHRFELYTDYRPGVEYILIDRRTLPLWDSFEPNLLKHVDEYTRIYSKDSVELYKIKK